MLLFYMFFIRLFKDILPTTTEICYIMWSIQYVSDLNCVALGMERRYVACHIMQVRGV